MFEFFLKTTHYCGIFKIFHITIFLLIFIHLSLGQYRFDQWTADTGLPQNSVYAIKQTRDGYLWLATVDGLVRFDGVRFTIFNKSNSPGIINNRFTSLYEAANGDLWAGTEDHGMVRYREGRFTSYGIENKPENAGYISGFIIDDKDGNLLVFSNYRVYRFSEGQLLAVNEETAASASAPPIVPTKQTPVFCYFNPESNQINCLGNDRSVKFPVADNLKDLIIFGSVQDIDGSFWFLTTNSGLLHLENGIVTKVFTKEEDAPGTLLLSVNGTRFSLVWQDKQGALWLTDLKARQKELLTPQPPLSFTAVHAAQEDQEGNIWLGSLRNGLFRVKKQVITAYSKDNGLSDNNVYPIFEDRRGVIWIGTTKGVFKYQNGAFTLVKGSGNFYVDALGEDASGRLLVSSTSGLYVLEGDKFKQFYQSPLGVMFAIYPEDENTLWIGSQNALIRIRDKIATTFTTKEGLAGNNVKVILDDKNGGMWIGTYGGLSHYQDGKFTSWAETSDLTIRALYQDQEGVLWIGTYDSGMARFKDGKFTFYTSRIGLYNDGVFQILEDGQGNFWISSNRGLYRVNKGELNDFAEGKRQTINSVAYGKSDGMLNVECNGGRMPGGIKAHDGSLWFPTQDGVAVVNPSQIKINLKPPPVIIEDIKIDNKSVPIETFNSVQSDLNSALQITPEQQDFEIQYTALSFINSENLHFKYKLEGLESEWVEAGTRRTAYFSHVLPGSYTFRVIASNADGVWNESGAEIKITVLPPFYRTWWFLTVVILSLMGLAWIIYRRRVSQLEREKKAQETLSRRLIELQENERQRLAGELHDSLSQNLVIIRNRAMMSLSNPDNVEHAFEQIEEIAEAATESLSEVREIAAALRPFQIDRLGLTKAIQSLIRKAASPNLRINSQIDDIDGILLPEMQINLYRILQESFNNIIKHANAAEARVIIEKTEKMIKIEISDNGQGFNSSEKPENNESTGGFGLSGMNERARILGAVLVIESVPGKGTSIRFQVTR